MNPTTAIEFAELAKARVLNLESDCGHIVVACESARITQAVSEFLRMPHTPAASALRQ